MPTCDRCKEHLALYEVAKVAALVLADMRQDDDYDYVRARVSVHEDLAQRLHEALMAFNKCDHGAA